MAKVYRKHRYHGVKYIIRQFNRRLVSLSRSLGFVLTTIYLLLPWFLKTDSNVRNILIALGIVSGLGAYAWYKRAGKLGGSMDIIAAGHDGEGAVAKLLARLPRDWAVLNDLALRAGGPIVQIDHLVISPAGLWVLETKAQKGQIISSPDTGRWQVKRRGETRSIVNPVEQNKAQVEACKLLLKELKFNIPCYGLVVMTESNARTNWPITSAKDMAKYIEESTRRNPTRLNSNKTRLLARSLLKFQITGKAPWQKGAQNAYIFALYILLPLLAYLLLWATL